MLTGKITINEFGKTIKTKFNLDINVIEKWKEAYLQVMPINYELLELVDKLKYDYKIGIISNLPKLHFEINKERDIFSHFDFAVLSCDVGFIKPQKEIFDLAIKKLNLTTEDCIFIDDRTEHLETPLKMGFQVINFKNNNQFIEELEKLGIKI
ncbi:HAD-IA family hydrolase [Candidatus Micrarchaeota archaeon]|nr:HAD-IA family hydrolase [Candidatus Micrarchaeota archaeon]